MDVLSGCCIVSERGDKTRRGVRSDRQTDRPLAHANREFSSCLETPLSFVLLVLCCALTRNKYLSFSTVSSGSDSALADPQAVCLGFTFSSSSYTGATLVSDHRVWMMIPRWNQRLTRSAYFCHCHIASQSLLSWVVLMLAAT